MTELSPGSPVLPSVAPDLLGGHGDNGAQDNGAQDNGAQEGIVHPRGGGGADAQTSTLASTPASTPMSLQSANATPEHPSPKGPEGSGEQETGFWPVLRNLNFLALWSGQVFSQLADKVYLVLMIGLISTSFQAAGQTISGWVSAIMIAFTIPAVLFGSAAGVLVGRLGKRRVLVVTNVLRSLLVLSVPVSLALAQQSIGPLHLPWGFWLLLATTFLVSTLTQFFAPAEQAIIPLVVPSQHLLSANSLYTTTMMAATIIGFAVGEQALDWAQHGLSPGLRHLLGPLGDGKSLAVGLSYAVAAGVLLLVRAKESLELPEQWHLVEDIREGLRYLRGDRLVRSALVELVILFSVFAALTVLAVRLAEVIPNLETDQFGVLLSAGSVGLALGALLVGQFGQRFARARLGLWGTVGMASSLVGLSLFSEQLVPALMLLGLLGVSSAWVAIPAQTTIQEKTPIDLRGKIFGLQNNAVNIALSLPLALTGLVEHYLGLRFSFIALVGLVLLGNGLTWYLGRNAGHPLDRSGGL